MISVIIPCFNCEETIADTLESLRTQTIKEFEVVCINDGSTDRTKAIILSWAENNDIDLSLIDQEHHGVSSARNNGIRHAKGEFICFLDADDEYHPHFLKALSGALAESRSDTASCRLCTNKALFPELSSSWEEKSQLPEDAMRRFLYSGGRQGFYCYIYRKELILRYDLHFDEDTHFGEDREFIWKYLCHCESTVFIDSPFYWYRNNNTSATRSRADWVRTDTLKAVIRVEQYLNEHHCDILQEYKSYAFPRMMMAVAKSFAISNNMIDFRRLGKEYDVKKCMKRTLKDKYFSVRLASAAYLFNKYLFFFTMRFLKPNVHYTKTGKS